MMRQMERWLGALALACVGTMTTFDRSQAATKIDDSLSAIGTTTSAVVALEEQPLSRPADLQLVGHCHRGYGGYAVPYQSYYGSYGYPSYQYRAVVVPRVSYRTYYSGYGGYGGGYGGYGYGYYGGYGGGCRVRW